MIARPLITDAGLLYGMRRVLALCCALLAATDAHAVRFERIESEGRAYVVAHVDPAKERIELFPAPPEGNTFAYVERQVAARKKKLVFATNGGMYQPDYSAVGLLVVKGKQLKPLNTARNNPDFNFTTKPNGVFAITKHGARVVESSRYAQIANDTIEATQSGPALVLNGALHPGLKPSSTSRHVRNGVGVTKSGEAIFVISEERHVARIRDTIPGPARLPRRALLRRLGVELACPAAQAQ
jgi:uncharacterized protein YigE (DUF2233 family)